MQVISFSIAVACGFDDARSHVTVGDGMAFISSKTAWYVHVANTFPALHPTAALSFFFHQRR
jgi:hypothetical protein